MLMVVLQIITYVRFPNGGASDPQVNPSSEYTASPQLAAQGAYLEVSLDSTGMGPYES